MELIIDEEKDKAADKIGLPLTRSTYAYAEEYLTLDEVAARLKVKKKTIQNKMAAGIFKKGVHYFSPYGLGPRFKWSALVAWLEGSQPTAEVAGDAIPMAKGYKLGRSPERN